MTDEIRAFFRPLRSWHPHRRPPSAMRFGLVRRWTWQMTMSGAAGDKEADEQTLLDAARAGDERALGLLFDRHRNGLEVYCYLMLGDRDGARSALADTALAAWETRGADGQSTSARVWLYRLAIRVCSEADSGCAIRFGATDRLTGEER